MTVVVERAGLAQLLDRLVATGRTVVAPIERDGVIDLAPIESLDDLAAGWSDEQSPGRYRLSESDHARLFATAAPAAPWKRYLHPPRELLVRTRRRPEGWTHDPGDEPDQAMVFFAMRSCDLAALHRLDTVLAADGRYRARRRDLVVVAVACTRAADTCFCDSMGTGPTPGDGADVVITELDHRLLVQARTQLGESLAADLADARDATDTELTLGIELVAAAAASQTRGLDPGLVAGDDIDAEHPDWDDVASTCLACGNCTMVCPTCFCTTAEDSTDLTGDVAERWQRWDSCFSLDFSYLHGGPVRTTVTARYRQWLLHKLVTWHDQFDSSGCVGCGRCITWCPTGIDLTAMASRLHDQMAHTGPTTNRAKEQP